MQSGKHFWWTVFIMTLVLGGVTASFAAARTPQNINLPDDPSGVVDDDTDVPDATARVARISFIRGDVQIRRDGATDWEKATLNLPIVEGDELTTSDGARVEIQFNNYSFLRLDENASLRLAVLKNEGIALSILQGTLSLRVTDLAKAAGYVEVDAPRSTVALQSSGTYRIDAGKAGDADIRLSVTNGGEARVYSDSAGFTLKSGRGARVFVDGSNAGEWELADAAQNADEFDSWAADRDSTIAKRIKDAYYDKYYDQDIYGADDLNTFGEWIHTSNYGYVWRPYATAIGAYADWSPYRYGHWRWVPPYGWTWVNDEPWGWATYHYGRWVYDNGYWVWTPYGYYRPSHSWWFPALVVINVIDDNVCWYPLQYHRRYIAYNHRDHDRDRDRDDHRGGGVRPTPTPLGRNGDRDNLSKRQPPRPDEDGIRPQPTPPSGNGIRDDLSRRKGVLPDADQVPPTGVVSVNSKDFGTRTHGAKPVPPTVATTILSRLPANGQGPELPAYGQLDRRVSRDIVTDKPKGEAAFKQTKVGAADRNPSRPLDQELRNTRNFGGRPPLKTNNDNKGGSTPVNTPPVNRKPGAVDRTPVRTGDDVEKGIKHGRFEPPEAEPTKKPDPPVKQPPTISPPREVKEPPKETPPVVKPPTRDDTPKREEKPRSDTPPSKPPTRVDSPPREVKPPSESPKPTPKSDPPKGDSKPTPKSDPPKSDPKTEGPKKPGGAES